MDLNEAVEKKILLEKDLTKLISDLCSIFKDDTGLSPSGVGVIFIENTEMGSTRKEFTIGEVFVKVEI